MLLAQEYGRVLAPHSNFTMFYKFLQFFTIFYNFLQFFTIFYKMLQFFTKFYIFLCATIIQLSLLYCRVCGLCIQQHSSVKIGNWSITMTVFVSVLTRAVESPLHCLLAVIPRQLGALYDVRWYTGYDIVHTIILVTAIQAESSINV